MAPNRTDGVPSMRKIQLRPALGRDYLSDYENLSTVVFFRFDSKKKIY